MPLLLLDVPCEPVPCPRPRVSKFGSYYPPRYRNWKKEFTAEVARIAPFIVGDIDLPLRGTLSISIDIYCTKPKTSKLEFPKPDLDNYVKGVLDSCNNLLWMDDSQITQLQARKSWGSPARVVIQIL